MVQPNVQKREKTINNDQPTSMPQPQVQTVMAVVVPADIYDKMKNAIKCLPHNEIELLLQTMKGLYPQPVNMQMPPPQIPQA